MRVRETRLSQWEISLVMGLDEELLDHHFSREGKRDSVVIDEKEFVVSERPVTAELFDAMFPF